MEYSKNVQNSVTFLCTCIGLSAKKIQKVQQTGKYSETN